MPNLLAINNYHYRRGGAEVVFLEQIRLFERQGWKAAAFAMQHPKSEPSPWSEYFAEEIEFGHDYPAWTKLRNALRIVYSGDAAGRLKKLLREFRPDVVHAHNIYHHLSPAVLSVAKKEGYPVCLTLHDMKLLCPAYNMLSAGAVCEQCKGGSIYHVVGKRCMKGSLPLSALIFVESAIHRLLGLYRNSVDRFVVPSRFLIDKCVEWGWSRERFVHVPNFVDAAALQPADAVGKAFLYFGRLSREKGLFSLVEAAARAKVPLWLVGTGPEEQALRAQAAHAGADVQFLGFRTGEDLWQVIRSCRAVVLPSEWYENAPVSILEAYALGKPILGARIGGIPEMIEDGHTGALFPSGDVESLAQLLSGIAAMDDRYIADWGGAARERVIRDYSPSAHVERLVTVYRDLKVAV